MAYCKHWKNGHCKDCRKNCPIKKKLLRKAARQEAPVALTCSETSMEFSAAPPALIEALAHGERVAGLAAKLYVGLAPLHRLEAPWDDVLAMAARLHDVGWVYGQKGHHKVSARMIRTQARELGEISPFGSAAVEAQAGAEVADGASGAAGDCAALCPLAALVARYHRRADPSTRQGRFAALSGREQRGVRRMAALLRLADALDYSHAHRVHDVETVIDEDAVTLVLTCPEGCNDGRAGGCTEEIDRVAVKKALFKKVFKKDVLCQCAKQEASALPDTEGNGEQAQTPAPEHAAEQCVTAVAAKPKTTVKAARKKPTPKPESPKPETSTSEVVETSEK